MCALCLFGEFCAHVSPIEHISGRTFSRFGCYTETRRDQTLRLAFSVQFINALESMGGIFVGLGIDAIVNMFELCARHYVCIFYACFNGIQAFDQIEYFAKSTDISLRIVLPITRIRILLLCVNIKPVCDRAYKALLYINFRPCIFVLMGWELSSKSLYWLNEQAIRNSMCVY